MAVLAAPRLARSGGRRRQASRDFATAADGKADGILELAQRSGLYLVTLNLHDAQEDTGPFTITGPDGPLFTDVTLRRGQYWFKTAPLRFRDGKAELRFTGNWKIGALTLQPILYEAEDFLLDRRWWNMKAGAPDADSQGMREP